MKILHCCLACFYIDDFSYQENMLPKYNKMHGHDVKIIASTETFMANGSIGYVKPSGYMTSEGIQVIRVPYRKILPRLIMKKIRAYKNVYSLIEEFEPDIIMFHGTASYELLNVRKYVKKHSNVKLYVDFHSDYNNSARGFFSKKIMHSFFYRHIILKCLPYISKALYITEEVREFVKEIYKIPDEMLEYYPLGGEIVSETEQCLYRKEIRAKHDITEDVMMIMHSGKLDKLKRTEVLIEGISKIQSNKVVLFIAGTIPDENIELQKKIDGSKCVKWIGWLDAENLKKYLCASDVYAQPGSQSATAQNAICCGKALMLYPHQSYQALCKDNVIWIDDSESVCNGINELLTNPKLVNSLGQASRRLAKTLLDYEALASRIER